MNSTSLLTIAMPVYERKDFFLEALESALNQTVKCKVIVVDNCSSHDYFELICKEKNVTYYRNDSNIGLFPNFNRCFELSDTDFVMTLQDDDILSPVYVESFLSAIQKHPDVDIFFTNFVRNRYITGEKYPHSHTLPFGFLENGEKVIDYGIRYKLGFPLISSCIKRVKFTGFYSEFHSCNDWLWIYSYADDLVFYGDSNVLYEFRDHQKQDTKTNSSKLNLSLPYIYEEILGKKVQNHDLKKMALNNSFWALVRFKSGAKRGIINEFINVDSLYSNYLKTKIKEDKFVKLLFALPSGMVNILYRLCKKIGLCA